MKNGSTTPKSLEHPGPTTDCIQLDVHFNQAAVAFGTASRK